MAATLSSYGLAGTTLRSAMADSLKDPNFTMPNHVEGIVSDEPLAMTNTLTHKREYLKVGNNAVFQVLPSILHFGGFQVGHVHSCYVKIRNCSPRSARLHIIGPDTPFFKVTCNKKGLVAPGMCEDLLVEFVPTEWRYYFDRVRIHSEDENLMIPIHAYPVMNETIFPTRIDFGQHAVMETVTKVFPLECKVPIQFEFEIKPKDPGKGFEEGGAFTISPLKGVVPADGKVDIRVEFLPTRQITATLEVEVCIAQFNSKSVTCMITGTGFPSKRLEAVPATMHAPTLGTNRLDAHGPTMEDLEGKWISPKPCTAFGPVAGKVMKPGKGGGAGGGDAYTRALQETKKGQPHLPLNYVEPPPPPAELDLQGIKVPPTLDTHGKVQYVMMQRAGKIRIKELKAVIAAQNAARAQTEQSLGESQALDWIDDNTIEPQLKEMLFGKEFNAVGEYEKQKKLKFGVEVGKPELTEAQIDDTLQKREAATLASEERQDALAMSRMDTEYSDRRAMFYSREKHEPEGFEATYNIYKNHVWQKRAQVVERFTKAVRITVFRNRAAKRLKGLKALLGAVGKDKSKVAGLVAQEILNTKPQENADIALARILPERIHEHTFPLEQSGNFRDRSEVPLNPIQEFGVIKALPLKVPLRYELQDYKPMECPAMSVYVPLMSEQPLMSGAEEEGITAGPRGIPDEELGEMPAAFRDPQREALTGLADRMTEDAVVSPADPLWGVDDPYAIQPQIFTYEDSVKTEVMGTNALNALTEQPVLSEMWLPRRENWLMQTVQVPPFMKGPEQEDLMEDPEGGEESRFSNVVTDFPTQESVAEGFHLPPSAVTVSRPEGDADESAPAPEIVYEIPRQRKEVELNASKRKLRDERSTMLEEQKVTYNKLLKNPNYRIS